MISDTDNPDATIHALWVGVAENDPFYRQVCADSDVCPCQTLYDALAELVAGRTCPVVVINVRAAGPMIGRFFHYLPSVRRPDAVMLYSVPAGEAIRSDSLSSTVNIIWADTPGQLQAKLRELSAPPSALPKTPFAEDRADQADRQSRPWPVAAPAESNARPVECPAPPKGDPPKPAKATIPSDDKPAPVRLTDEELRALLGSEYTDESQANGRTST